MTSLVAFVLSGMYTVLKPTHKKNEALYAKKSILAAVADHLGTDFGDLSSENIQNIFDKNVEQLVLDVDGKKLESSAIQSLGYSGGQAEHVDMAKEHKKAEGDKVMPLFVYTTDAGKKYYIVSVRGKGLWDYIWGCIALEDDLNTIAGVSFDHKAETPGLGAEIKDNAAFKKQFVGKKLYDLEGNFKSIWVKKGGIKEPDHQVDAISGATITGDGITEMMKRGIAYYEPYFKTI